MPRKTEWTHRIDSALDQLRAVSSPSVDRAAVERLLGVSPRQALRIMHRLTPHAAGKSLVIPRQDLIRQLEELRDGGPIQGERQRLERLTAELEKVRRHTAAHHIAVPAPVCPVEWRTLPDGIQLEPGRLEIRFETGAQLLGLLLELAQAVAGDLEQFQAAIGEAGQIQPRHQ